jgi:hypothetical protein
MSIHSNRLSGQLFQQAVLTATTARVRFRSSVKNAGAIFQERVILFMNDIDLFTSLCLARFILWRRTRKKL